MRKTILIFTAALCFCAMNKATAQVVSAGTTGNERGKQD
jgi:hypothetical protein